LPLGKVLGGSGSINAMVWACGHRADYDGWAEAGNAGWDFRSVLHLFKRAEDWEDGGSEFRGAGGPIHVERARDLHLESPATRRTPPGRLAGLVRIEALVAQHLVDPAHRRPPLAQHRQGRRGEHAVRVVVRFDP
jgi:choline dehydrogenase-like flavoprotein